MVYKKRVKVFLIFFHTFAKKNMEQDKKQSYSFINILNISASIASLTAFMMMIAGEFNDQLSWRILIKYITYALWISGTCSAIVYTVWKVIMTFRRKKKIFSWCTFPIFCLVALFLIITLVKMGTYVSDFFVFWTFGDV